MPASLTPIPGRAVTDRHPELISAVNAWFGEAARDLPWRGNQHRRVSPWAVMVSEFMLQQTPVARVLEPWQAWMRRWPSPTALADAPTSEAIRAWGRLGYPRRALRLHQSALIISEQHAGEVPSSIDELRALPGIGDYTAAAIATFAFGQRHAVCDINIRRVLARSIVGQERPASNPVVERRLAELILPRNTARATTWAAASMELGALVCTSRSPNCGECPIASRCAWRQSGYPAHDGPPPRGQAWHGTDRQCRGRLMAVLRDTDRPVARADFVHCWPDEDAQRERCLDSLVADGLVVESPLGFLLPH